VNLPAAIDAILEHTLEVDPRDYNAIRLRRRVWLRSIEALQEIWDSWDWDFRYRVDVSLTLPSGDNEVSAPSDFHSIAYEGAMWIPAQRTPVLERPSNWLMEYRRANPTVTGVPEYFAAFGESDTGIPMLRFDKLASGDVVLQLDYERRPPALTDRPDDLAGTVVPDTVSTFTAGDYGWKLVYVTAEGESFPSAAEVTTLDNGATDTITLTIPKAPTWAQVTSKRLYGTQVDGSTYRLHTTGIDPETETLTLTAPVSGSADVIGSGYSGLERLPEGLFGVLLEGLKVAMGYDEGDSRSGGEAEGRFRKRLGRFQRESPAYERKARIGDLGLTAYRMH
jgi:hypothetical protein